MPRKSKDYTTSVTRSHGEWIGRLLVKLPNGGVRSYSSQARNKSHAKDIVDDLVEKFVTGGIELLDAENMTFATLADHYKKAKVIDAVYDGEIKVAGMQSKRSATNEVAALVRYWGETPVRLITHAAIERFKLERLRTSVVHRWKDGEGKVHEKPRDEPRKMTSVNHELRRLRAMFNFAKRRGWIRDNPFNLGEPLISEAAEIPRNRAEKPGELARILAACTGKRAHMRPIILAMVDTALRLSEVRRLSRSEIDFKQKVAHVRARNTKTNKARIVPLSDRLLAELAPLCEKAKGHFDPIFTETDSNKNAWKAIKEEAKITDDLQLRDLRGWGTGRIATALARNNQPWEHGMKTTGHTQIKTYLRYIKTDVNVAQAVGDALKSMGTDEEKGEKEKGAA
jgi:integrase